MKSQIYLEKNMNNTKEKFLRYETSVYSKKYNIHGFVKDYGIGSRGIYKFK